MVFNWFKRLLCVFLGFGVTTTSHPFFKHSNFALNVKYSFNDTI